MFGSAHPAHAYTRTEPDVGDIYIGLAHICKSSKADVCLTLGDIGPIALPVLHVIYLHQPYLVYPEPDLNATLPWLERLKLYYQRWHFQRSVNNSKAVIVQHR